MNKDLKIRKQIRWDKHDYSSEGRYFITICTEAKSPILWKNGFEIGKYDYVHVGANCVRPQNLPLSSIGICVETELERWNTVYENVKIDYYVIMPNHIHLVLRIEKIDDRRTQFAPTVSQMVKQFKGKITKSIGQSVFQRSFYDRVIRSEEEYVKICNYIYSNPIKWREDELYVE